MSKPIQPNDNKKKMPPHAVELKFGYDDKETSDLQHKFVRYGTRPTAADFIRAADECGGSDLQFALGLAQAAIVEFGQIEMPVPMTILLSLNQIDREKLTRTYFSFLVETGSADGVIGADGAVTLGFGVERGKQKIIQLKFGRLLTGYDEIEIEREAVGQWNANVLRMIKEISTPGDLTVAEIEALDVDDFTLLRNAEEQWLNSFRGE